MADVLVNETSCCLDEGLEVGADPGSRAGRFKLEPCSNDTVNTTGGAQLKLVLPMKFSIRNVY